MNVLTSAIAALIVLASSTAFGHDNILARLIICYCIFLFLFLLLNAVFDRSASVLMIAVSFYHLAMFFIPGMLHCAQGWFPFFEATYGQEVIFQVSMLLAVYSTCFAVGYQVAGRWRPSKLTVEWKLKRIDETTIIILSVITIGVSLACMATAGFEAFFLRRADRDLLGADPTPAFLILTNLPRVASLCALLVVADRARATNSAFMIILTIPLSILALAANNPLTIARFQLFGAAFIVLFAWKLLATQSRKVLFAAALLGGQFVALPLMDSLARGEEGTEFSFRPLEYLAEHGDFDGLQSTLNTYILVDLKGFSYGRQLLGAILTFVPRNLWPSKPYATGQTAAEALGFPFTNLSAPLPAEIYVDFGIFGLIILSFALGCGVRRLDFGAQRAALTGAPMTTRLLYGGVIGYATILCRGALLAVAAPIYLYFGVNWIWSSMARMKSKRAG